MEVKFDRKKLIEARYAKGMNVAQLAKRAGVAQMTVWNLERNLMRTTPSTIKKLCEALGLRVEDVIQFAEDAS